MKKEELDRFYREHIENRKPHTAFKRTLSVSNYIPTPTLDVPEKTVVKPVVKKKQPFRYEGYTRELKNDDPTSFPSHEDQQKNMLVDVIADAKQTENLNAIKKFGHEESQIKSPPPKKMTAQDIKKEEEDPRTEGRMEELQKIDDKGKSWFSKYLKKSQSEKEMTIERKNRDIAKKEKTNDG